MYDPQDYGTEKGTDELEQGKTTFAHYSFHHPVSFLYQATINSAVSQEAIESLKKAK